MKCRICGTEDHNRAMCFRGYPYCSDTCRKVLLEDTSIRKKNTK